MPTKAAGNTLCERPVVQQACKIVIEPVFEANFRDNSYGFRPKRSAQQAIKVLKKALFTGWYVVEADIQSYYDTLITKY